MKNFKTYLAEQKGNPSEEEENNYIEHNEIFVVKDGKCKILSEGKWLKGENIRIDQPTHGAGKVHAHIYDRKHKQIGVVNIDGTPSHGTKFRLSDKQADILRNIDFDIPSNNIVECKILS